MMLKLTDDYFQVVQTTKVPLVGEKSALEGRVAELESEQAATKQSVADLQRQMQQMELKFNDMNYELTLWKYEITTALGLTTVPQPPGGAPWSSSRRSAR